MQEDALGFANLMKRRGYPDALQAGQVVPISESDTTHDEGNLEALRLLRNVRERKMQPPHPDQGTATPLIVDL